MPMRYLLYMGRDGHGVFAFVKRIDEAPPKWPGLRLEIVGAYLDKAAAERALLEFESSRSGLGLGRVAEDTQGYLGSRPVEEPDDNQ